MSKSNGSKQVEIGEVVQLDTETKSYLIHCRGNQAKEAKAIKYLLDNGWTQGKIGAEMHLTQGAISKRMNLFNLIPVLFKMFETGKLLPSAGYLLSSLPKEEQEKFANQKERITVKQAEAARRGQSVSNRLTEALGSADIGFGGDAPVEDVSVSTVDPVWKFPGKKTFLVSVEYNDNDGGALDSEKIRGAVEVSLNHFRPSKVTVRSVPA